MKIRKRDGRIVAFDDSKITDAIFAAAQAVGGADREMAVEITLCVLKCLKAENKEVVDVEHVQDIVEKVLIKKGHAKTAKSYILYPSVFGISDFVAIVVISCRKTDYGHIRRHVFQEHSDHAVVCLREINIRRSWHPKSRNVVFNKIIPVDIVHVRVICKSQQGICLFWQHVLSVPHESLALIFEVEIP